MGADLRYAPEVEAARPDDAEEPRTAAEEERVVAEAARVALEAEREAEGTERVTVLAASDAVREAVAMRPADALEPEPCVAAAPPAVRTTRPTPARGLAETLMGVSPRVAISRPWYRGPKYAPPPPP